MLRFGLAVVFVRMCIGATTLEPSGMGCWSTDLDRCARILNDAYTGTAPTWSTYPSNQGNMTSLCVALNKTEVCLADTGCWLTSIGTTHMGEGQVSLRLPYLHYICDFVTESGMADIEALNACLESEHSLLLNLTVTCRDAVNALLMEETQIFIDLPADTNATICRHLTTLEDCVLEGLWPCACAAPSGQQVDLLLRLVLAVVGLRTDPKTCREPAKKSPDTSCVGADDDSTMVTSGVRADKERKPVTSSGGADNDNTTVTSRAEAVDNSTTVTSSVTGKTKGPALERSTSPTLRSAWTALLWPALWSLGQASANQLHHWEPLSGST